MLILLIVRLHIYLKQLDDLHNSQIDQTRYEELPQQTNNRIIDDLTERFEESLKALNIVQEERNNLSDEVEAYRTSSEVCVMFV